MSKNNIANPVFQGSAIFERGIKINGLTKKHVGLLNVDNTTDALKPISNPTKLYVDTKISDLIGGAPDALNTLKEIATAIGSNPVPADLGAIKANVKDPTFTGSARFNNYIDPTNGQVTSGDVKFAVPATFTTAPKAFTLGLNNLVVPSVPVNLEDLTTKQYVDTKASETVASGNAATATKLANARLIGGVSFDGSANIDLPGVNSIGNQSTNGNAATASSVPYSGLTGVVPTWNQSTTGNAATATKLATARSIGGVSFDGSGDINLPGVNSIGNQSTNGNAATASSVPYSGLTGVVPTWNQSTTGNAATASSVPYSGLTGDIPTWNQSTTGNAATATKLANARLIGGVSFDGSANIDLPGVNSIGNQSTTGNAATVTTNANLTGVVTSIGNTTSIADDGLSIAKTNGLQEALNDKAPINNPTFTGTVSGLFSVEETEYFTPPSVASAGTMIFDYISNNLYICVKSWFESSTGEAVWKIVATTSI